MPSSTKEVEMPVPQAFHGSDEAPEDPGRPGVPSRQANDEEQGIPIATPSDVTPFDDTSRGTGILHMYTQYLIDLVREKATGASMPKEKVTGTYGRCNIPLILRGELDCLASQVVRAWNNRVQLDFGLIEVAEALDSLGTEPRNQFLREKFASGYKVTSNGSFPLVDEPTVFIDCDDLVVAWYLPGAFSHSRSTTLIRLVELYGEEVLQLRGERWQANRVKFANREKCVVPPGIVEFGVCAYDQEDGLRKALPRPTPNLYTSLGRSMLKSLRSSLAVIGSLLGVIHPHCYNQQMAAYEEMHDRPAKHTAEPELAKHLLDDWCTPFDVITLSANREDESRRNSRTGPFCIDVLATFGSYRGGRLEVPLLGRRFLYNPGTAFALPGNLFEYGSCRTDGENICITGFLTPAIARGILGDEWKDALPPTADVLMNAFDFKRPEVDSGNIWE
ncbi:hypothetical protein NMY22_g5753 [Coprinellus aureogranulatus]|nr:hypothetical protein NMY22_g5753 [Coprinellus aureogranulatus]